MGFVKNLVKIIQEVDKGGEDGEGVGGRGWVGVEGYVIMGEKFL